MFPQHLTELVFEVCLSVMRFLILDIFFNGFDIRTANRKSSISSLPGETGEFTALGFYPFRRTCFNLFNHVGDGYDSRQRKKGMDVIFFAANF